jgi:3-phenylpropionate/trans-cinnamate dioxygenase ferredoxin reductase component
MCVLHDRIMDSRGVVIAGGGLAAQRCAERLRRRGYDAPIRMVSEEPRRPYDRPPLSKELLAGDPVRRLSFREEDWYADNDVELRLGERAAHLDAAGHTLELESGRELRYDHLLIATGAAPRRLPPADRFSNTHYLRTLADASSLRGELTSGARLAIIGAGFIGLEVAATARRLGVEVTIVEVAELPLAGILGARLGRWFAEMHADENVSLKLACEIIDFAGNGRVEQLRLASGETVDCDALVVAIGVAPSLEWLNGSGLDHAGIEVDSGGRTGIPDVYAAGDVCRGSEHWETAVQQGVAAADAMLGFAPEPAPPASFWSDQYGVRIQYLGNARLADDVEIDGDPAQRDFTALFTRAGEPVAALLAGRPRALPETRRLIAKGTEQ